MVYHDTASPSALITFYSKIMCYLKFNWDTSSLNIHQGITWWGM